MNESIWAVAGTAVAALGVWVGVRFVNRREKWAKRTLVELVLLLPLLYLLSFGIACAYVSRSRTDAYSIPMLPHAYQPLGWINRHGPQFASAALSAYGRLWMPRHSIVGIPVGKFGITPIQKS
jgi:hypothetical protein